MNAPVTKGMDVPKTGLALLREPFPAHQISKLPKPTKKQTEAVTADCKVGIRCTVCGAWHHKDVVHLDYVGHAALTDRLLECDQAWNWEPVATAENGTPALDGNGGMWIRLTVCGVTRLGYGHPDGKKGGDAIKEVIGDALRNAAMRFGAALDLWHKGDLHGPEDDEPQAEVVQVKPAGPPRGPSPVDIACDSLGNAETLDQLSAIWHGLPRSVQGDARVITAKDKSKAALQPKPADLGGDQIPY